MKAICLVAILLIPASPSFAETRTIRIVFTSCLRGACLADATNAVKAAKLGIVGKVHAIHLDDGLGSFLRDPKSQLDLRALAKQIANYNSGLKEAILEVDGTVEANVRITESGQELNVGPQPCSTPVRPEWGKPPSGTTWLVWQPTPKALKGGGALDVCIAP